MKELNADEATTSDLACCTVVTTLGGRLAQQWEKHWDSLVVYWLMWLFSQGPMLSNNFEQKKLLTKDILETLFLLDLGLPCN